MTYVQKKKRHGVIPLISPFRWYNITPLTIIQDNSIETYFSKMRGENAKLYLRQKQKMINYIMLKSVLLHIA